GPRAAQVPGHRDATDNPIDERLHQAWPEAGVELEAIDATGDEVVHRGLRPRRILDDPGEVGGAAVGERTVAEDGRHAIEQRPVGVDARADLVPGGYSVAE